MVSLLTCIYNSILKLDIYRSTLDVVIKGKNMCLLDVNNYRGITLLSCMNKLFEVLIWERIKGWLSEEGVISLLQGECHRGSSYTLL